MTADELERALALFAEARDCPADQQAAFLAQACPDDEVLRRRVASLLRSQEEAGGFLEEPAFGQGLKLIQRMVAGRLQADEVVGEYRVLSLLGVGGMGEVYLAEDNVHDGRQVALKLIGQGRGEEVRGRHFRHERKVLAALNHPGIARLYGSGVTPDNRAYLVMEYVEGERLDRFCQEKDLGVAERLALFRKVCAAVAYAHQNLVVHRDLKPANIRVTPEGEPKLLDFGIAKLLDPEGTTHTDPTVTMQGAMTPEYASPEQIKGEAITTASDVYSLGAVLYELLTGRRPFEHLKGRRPDELARAVCEEEPPRPSTVANRTNSAPTTTPWLTELTPAMVHARSVALRRQLEGDLDNIVAKALQKEPGRRYASVAAFSEDLRRNGEGLPVTARKDTVRYRAGKFVRRNRTAVVAAALIISALLIGLVTAAWQAHAARQERDHAQAAQIQAEAERKQAELARKQAEQLNGFLQTLLGSASPRNGPGRDMKVVQVLDQASAQLDHELAGEPALLAQAHQTLGNAYASLEVTEPALHHLQAALAINRQLYGEDARATVRSKAALGAAIFYLQRNAVEAEGLLREAVAAEERQPLADQAEQIRSRLAFERLLYDSKRFQEADAQLAETCALIRRTQGEESSLYAEALDAVGLLRLNQMDHVRAEAAFRQSIAICRRLPQRVPVYPELLSSLAYDLLLQGKTDEPEGLLHEALDLIRQTMGEDNLSYHFNVGLLGLMYFERGDYPATEREMRHVFNFSVPGAPSDSEDAVGARAVMGLSLTRQGRPAEGETYLREALKDSLANHMTAPMISPPYLRGALAECLVAQRRYADAEPLLLENYDETKAQGGQGGQPSVQSAARLHDFYLAWNKPAEAARFEPKSMVQVNPAP